MYRKPQNVFEVYLSASANPLGWEPVGNYADRILSLWAASGHPPIIAVQDPTTSLPSTVYFVFYLGQDGPDFVVHYKIPTPESLAEKSRGH